MRAHCLCCLVETMGRKVVIALRKLHNSLSKLQIFFTYNPDSVSFQQCGGDAIAVNLFLGKCAIVYLPATFEWLVDVIRRILQGLKSYYGAIRETPFTKWSLTKLRGLMGMDGGGQRRIAAHTSIKKGRFLTFRHIVKQPLFFRKPVVD